MIAFPTLWKTLVCKASSRDSQNTKISKIENKLEETKGLFSLKGVFFQGIWKIKNL